MLGDRDDNLLRSKTATQNYSDDSFIASFKSEIESKY